MTSTLHNDLSPEHLFDSLEPHGIVLVGVSGGGDSVALLLLANAWAQSRDITLHAVTVDHGLRPEAAAEAAFVASLCAGLGIDHTTLGWEGVKPHSGIADAARRARYALMEEFAIEIGADIILTGHTADDQVETVFMRLKREWMRSSRSLFRPEEDGRGESEGDSSPVGAGRGYAGMPRRSLLPGGIELIRPLLGVTRERLRSYLADFPQNWIEDPTNWDRSFERVRVRRRLADDGPMRQKLHQFSRVMNRYRNLLASDTAMLLGATVDAKSVPALTFDHAIASEAPEPVLVHALQILIAVAGGAEFLVPAAKIAKLRDSLQHPEFRRTNLGGAIVERSGHKLRFYREMRAIETIVVEPDERLVWDGRLEVFNAGKEAVSVGPLTRKGLAEVEEARGRAIGAKPRTALLSSAVVRSGKNRTWLPMVEKERDGDPIATRLTARAIEQFCPEADFPLVEWLKGIDRARNASLQSRT